MKEARNELRAKKNFITRTQAQIKAKSDKNEANRAVWFTKRLKAITAENDHILEQFEKNYDLLYEETEYM